MYAKSQVSNSDQGSPFALVSTIFDMEGLWICDFWASMIWICPRYSRWLMAMCSMLVLNVMSMITRRRGEILEYEKRKEKILEDFVIFSLMMTVVHISKISLAVDMTSDG